MTVIGGGSGLSMLLRSLKPAHRNGEIGQLTAVVTVSDDGGSSGRLRADYGIIAPGDIRNCLVALADEEDVLSTLFQFRFDGTNGLTGHSFGNLFMTALTAVTGDFYQAILVAERILAVSGRVLPSTLANVRLLAQGESGKAYSGESSIGSCGEPLVALALDPAEPQAFAPAIEAIARADLLLIGPGSLFTSILPNLLLPQIRDAILRRRGPSILILNLMTQPGETTGMDGQSHVDAFMRHAGEGLIDVVLANASQPTAEQLRRYAAQGSGPVKLERIRRTDNPFELVEVDLLGEGEVVRHDSAKLCDAILNVLRRDSATTAEATLAAG
ncbi:MAG: uridine diphosphate-N-acetylglucosamine-binding protein YvcK [Dehalococcoidia bacterium]